MKISIIIPIYNCAKYLHECIDSCLSEKNEYDIEVLLIDDGSTDGSKKICDEYASQYSQVRVIHTENRGVSSARNTGIEESTGDWIMFVDADDILEPNTLRMLDEQANFHEYEIIRFQAFSFKKEGEHCPYIRKYSENIEGYRDLVLQRQALLGVWGGIYKKELFIKHSIRFNPNLCVGEDWLVLFKLLCHASNFCFLNVSLYGYRINPGSVTNKKIDCVRPDALIAYNIILDYAKEHGVSLKKASLRVAMSDLRRGHKRRAVFSNSRMYYVDVYNVLQRYVPQSIWNDIIYCKKPKHILVFLTYAILSPCYRLFAKVISRHSKH